MGVKISLDLHQIKITALPDNSKIQTFRCGEAEIDDWAKDCAQKFHSENRTKVFCAIDSQTKMLCGFYSLSFSNEDARKLSDKYRDIYNTKGIPLVYIGYLAVTRSCQGQKLGSFLLVDALKRAALISQHIAFYGVALRSLNDRTTKLYEGFGFGKKDDDHYPLMIIPIWTIHDLFKIPVKP